MKKKAQAVKDSRSKPRTLDPELVAEFEAIAAGAGCELVHTEFKGGTLRLFIDRPDDPQGVSIADCELVSKQVSTLLDVVDFSDGRYVLEVSSPGLDRQLYRPKDYERFLGRLARVSFVSPESGDKRTVVGRLEAFRGAQDDESASGQDEGEVTVRVEETDEVLTLSLSSIQVARLEVEL